jgi:LAO/AO transport system kinase
VVLIETVGIGQSEISVRSMVDLFALLLQPGAGDQLQGIKKGVLELADALVVNKGDGEQKAIAERTRQDHVQALQLLRSTSATWRPPVLVVSSLTGEGIPGFWEAVLAHREALRASGEFQARRRSQAREWMWALVGEGLQQAFRRHPEVAGRVAELEADVEAQRMTPAAAARTLLEAFQGS